MSDLSQLLWEAVAHHTSSTDLGDVYLRARRRERGRRAMTGFVAAAVFMVAAWFGWEALRPQREIRIGDARAWGTYILSDFDVGPHVDPWTDEVVQGDAEVTFRASWSSDVYPGEHDCSLRVLDPTGGVIGRLTLSLIALTEGPLRPIEVPVSGAIEGATAEGSCDPQRLDSPVAYTVSDVRVVTLPPIEGQQALEVHYRVNAPAELAPGEYPGTNACAVAVFRQDGTVLGTSELTVTAGSGSMIEHGVSRDVGSEIVSSDLSANVVCVPFADGDAFPDATDG